MKARFIVALFPLAAFAVVHCGASEGASPLPAPAPIADASPPLADAAALDASDAATPIGIDAATDSLAHMVKARSLFAAVTGKDNRIRTFGGLNTVGLDVTTEAYDPVANTWKAASGTASAGRYGNAAAQDAAGLVYVIGGTSNGKTPIASVEAYSPADDTWRPVADLPTARLGLAAATGKDGRIYAIGGRDASNAPTDVVEVYSPATQTWSTAPSLPTKRLSLVAVTGADGKIYAIGGRDAATNPLTVVEVFDIDAGTWATAAPLITGRFWFGATLGTDGRIYALGGLGNHGMLDDVEAFTPATGWTALTAMPEARGWLGAASSADGRVFAIGGSTPSGDLPSAQPPPMRTMLSFDPKTSAWTK